MDVAAASPSPVHPYSHPLLEVRQVPHEIHTKLPLARSGRYSQTPHQCLSHKYLPTVQWGTVRYVLGNLTAPVPVQGRHDTHVVYSWMTCSGHVRPSSRDSRCSHRIACIMQVRKSKVVRRPQHLTQLRRRRIAVQGSEDVI
jgi:hypothetical protein